MFLYRLAAWETPLKWIALAFGVASTLSVVQGLHLVAMLFSLPFCLIWIFCAWLHTEVQLKWINILFAGLYVYGIDRYILFHT